MPISDLAAGYHQIHSPYAFLGFGAFLLCVGTCITWNIGGIVRSRDGSSPAPDTREESAEKISRAATTVVGAGMLAFGVIALVTGIAGLL